MTRAGIDTAIVEAVASFVAAWCFEVILQGSRREETGNSTGNFARYALVVHVGSELIPI